jgi:hypothetical protein
MTVRSNCWLGGTIYVVMEPRETTTQACAKHAQLMRADVERHLHRPDALHCGRPALVESQSKPTRKQLASFHTTVSRPTLVVALNVDLGHPSATILFIEPKRALKDQVRVGVGLAIGKTDDNVLLSILYGDVSSVESRTHAIAA